jgi:hypothetical protein
MAFIRCSAQYPVSYFKITRAASAAAMEIIMPRKTSLKINGSQKTVENKRTGEPYISTIPRQVQFLCLIKAGLRFSILKIIPAVHQHFIELRID